MTGDNAFKACPFCGKNLELGYLGYTHPNIPTTCPARYLVVAASDSAAIAAWNTRSPVEDARGELVEALEAVDEADKGCPIRAGRQGRDGPCPKCGADVTQGCGPVASAEYRVVKAARALAKSLPSLLR